MGWIIVSEKKERERGYLNMEFKNWKEDVLNRGEKGFLGIWRQSELDCSYTYLGGGIFN
jgi:hypothetical protein